MLEKSPLQPIRPPAEEALLLVCEKCGKHADCSGKELRKELKAMVKERGDKKRLRVVSVGCLDVCPKQGVCVGVARRGSPAEYFVAKGEAAGAAAAVLSRL